MHTQCTHKINTYIYIYTLIISYNKICINARKVRTLLLTNILSFFFFLFYLLNNNYNNNKMMGRKNNMRVCVEINKKKHTIHIPLYSMIYSFIQHIFTHTNIYIYIFIYHNSVCIYMQRNILI